MDGTVDACSGVFHSIGTQASSEEYPLALTVCDVDNVVAVHDMTTRRLLATLERPEEVAQTGARPHDVTANADYIFVTFLGSSTGPGFVVSYSATTFAMLGVLETADDPHVAIRNDSLLYVASQGGTVYQISIPDLTILFETDRPSPHGMIISFDSKYLYTTNIAESGAMALETWSVDTGERMEECAEVVTSFAVPHNPALSIDGRSIFLTHSGSASIANTRFAILENGCVDPNSETLFETDLNPFGIAVIPAAQNLLTCSNAD